MSENQSPSFFSQKQQNAMILKCFHLQGTWTAFFPCAEKAFPLITTVSSCLTETFLLSFVYNPTHLM